MRDRDCESADSSTSAAELPTNEEMLERRDRLSGFLAAWRALSSQLEVSDANAGRTLGRELQQRLDSLNELVRRSGSAEQDAGIASTLRTLIDFDADLDAYALRLCEYLEEVPRGRWNSHPTVGDDAKRGGLLALVDFLLRIDPGMDAHAGLLEEFVTLLSTDHQQGRFRVVHDPVMLTPMLRAATERAAAQSQLDLAEIEREFMEAAASCLDDPGAERVHEKSARKAEIGAARFAPQALRAVIYFNAAAWSDAWGTPAQEPEGVEASEELARRDDPSANPESAALRDVAAVHDGSTFAGVAASVESEGATDTIASPTAKRATSWQIHEPIVAVEAEVSDESPHQVRRRLRHRALAAASVITALLMVNSIWLEGSEDSIEILASLDLGEISPQLASGYRDGFGAGPLFVGTVGPTWNGMSADERRQSALGMVAKLDASGMPDVLVYDGRRRLVVESAKGLPLIVGP